MFALAMQDPIPILRYALRNHLTGQEPFKTLGLYCVDVSGSYVARAHKVKTRPGAAKYKFGIQVPLGMKQAFALDKANNNLKWQEAIVKELEQLHSYKTFRKLKPGEQLSDEYKQIPYHIVFDVKFDLRHKARLVAGGNWTVLVKEDIYSGVVAMETVRLGFAIGELNNLQCVAGDVGNAYLHSTT